MNKEVQQNWSEQHQTRNLIIKKKISFKVDKLYDEWIMNINVDIFLVPHLLPFFRQIKLNNFFYLQNIIFLVLDSQHQQWNGVKTFHFYNSYNATQQHAVATQKLIYYQFFFCLFSALFLQLRYLYITYITIENIYCDFYVASCSNSSKLSDSLSVYGRVYGVFIDILCAKKNKNVKMGKRTDVNGLLCGKTEKKHFQTNF